MTQLKDKTFGFWIGGHRGEEINPFKWVNNDPFDYSNWQPGFPDPDTLVSSRSIIYASTSNLDTLQRHIGEKPIDLYSCYLTLNQLSDLRRVILFSTIQENPENWSNANDPVCYILSKA